MKNCLVILMLLLTSFSSYAEAPIDPIINNVTENGFEDVRRDSFKWVIDHPFKASKNKKLKAFVFKSASVKYGWDGKEAAELKVKTLKAAGWYDEWIKQRNDALNRMADELIRGDFMNQDKGMAWIEIMEEMEIKNLSSYVRFLAPLSLIRGGVDHNRFLAKLMKLDRPNFKSIEKELIKSKPQTNFWFSGTTFEGQPIKELSVIFPNIVKMAKDECERYLKDQNVDPIHVHTGACSWLKSL